jgi:hypothetical protein
MENCGYSSEAGEIVCDEPIVSAETANFFGVIVVWILLLAVVIALIFFLARYAYQVATRTGRSRVGFVWLSIFLPFVAWVICLLIDTDERRYTDEDRDKIVGNG